MAMLEVKDINVYYGLIHALRDVSFEVNEGEVVALIGANGAGKTTTLHTVTGLLPSKGGTVTFEGKDITHKPPACLARPRLPSRDCCSVLAVCIRLPRPMSCLQMRSFLRFGVIFPLEAYC